MFTKARHAGRLLKEATTFAVRERRWWLIPLIVTIVLLGALVVFTENSVLSPLLYTIF